MSENSFRNAARTVQIIVIVSVLLAITVRCAADEKSEAKLLFDEGKTYFIEKNYEAAIESFLASVEKYPTYNGYFNLANCYRAVRRYGDALKVVKTMRETLGPSSKPEMRQKFEAFEVAVMGIVGRLRVSVEESGATVVVDGKAVGRSPLYEPLLLGPGYHELTVRKPGFEDSVLHVEVKSEQDTSISVSLEEARADLYLTVNISGALVTVDAEPMGKTPLRDTLKLKPGNHDIAVSKPGYRQIRQSVNIIPGAKTALSVTLEPASPAVVGPDARKVDTANFRGTRSTLFWGMLSGTIVSAVMGGIFWGLTGVTAGDFNKNNTAYVDAPDDDAAAVYDKERKDDRRKGLAYDKAAIGLSIVAGVLAVGTGTVLVYELKQPSTETPGPTVAITPGSLTVRF